MILVKVGSIYLQPRLKIQNDPNVFFLNYHLSAILKRDGANVKVDSECKPTSGSWISPYTGQTFTDASKLDIVSTMRTFLVIILMYNI